MSHRHSPPSKGRPIHPWQCIAAACDFLPNDPPPGLFDSVVAARGKLREQGGLTAAGTSRQHNEAVAHALSFL
jgi:hypothetical protein